ncbi:hypothetical protein fBA3_002 [Acinetobacter virus fBenAci003]|uniref:Uncharacterized protein n=1 Tax=Acinetobacter virus fBenAci003 TaxID=2781370 RepID=A0A7S6RAG3_9CAUD|nr:hypothetical protein fBA3_002 [Acinetobacter virus fBenAci003]
MKRYKCLDQCNHALYYNGWYTNFHLAVHDEVLVHDDFGNLVSV